MSRKLRSILIGLAAVAGLVLAVIPASAAQAVSLKPPGESFTSLATNSRIMYGGVTITCARAGASGYNDGPPTTDTAELTSFPLEDCKAVVPGVGVGVPGVRIDSITSYGFPWKLQALTATGNGSGTGKARLP